MAWRCRTCGRLLCEHTVRRASAGDAASRLDALALRAVERLRRTPSLALRLELDDSGEPRVVLAEGLISAGAAA